MARKRRTLRTRNRKRRYHKRRRVVVAVKKPKPMLRPLPLCIATEDGEETDGKLVAIVIGGQDITVNLRKTDFSDAPPDEVILLGDPNRVTKINMVEDWEDMMEERFGSENEQQALAKVGEYTVGVENYKRDGVNLGRAPSVMDFSNINASEEERHHRTLFAQLMERIAEDLAMEPTEGDDEWNKKDLLMRPYTGKALKHCRQSRTKDRLVLMLDSSPSCTAQTKFFISMAKSAYKAGDVEIYLVPNGTPTAKVEFDREGNSTETYLPINPDYDFGRGTMPKTVKPSGVAYHGEWPQNQTVVFFGDWDGRQSLVQESKNNRIYWFCCVSSYPTKPEGFRGHYIPGVYSWASFIECIRHVK